MNTQSELGVGGSSHFLVLLVWSSWSTCQVSLAEYVAKVISMADGQGHLSGEEGPACHLWHKRIAGCKSLLHVHENNINELQAETSFLKWILCKNNGHCMEVGFCGCIYLVGQLLSPPYTIVHCNAHHSEWHDVSYRLIHVGPTHCLTRTASGTVAKWNTL